MVRSLLVLLVVVPSVASAPVPKEPERADFFPLALGHKWEYTGGHFSEIEVTAADAAADGKAVNFTVRMSDRDRNDYTLFLTRCEDGSLLLNRNSLNGYQSDPFRTPVEFLPAALRAGHKWARVFDTGSTPATTLTFEVGLQELLTVGGRSYTAAPVYTQGQNGSSAGTIWYAAGVGVVKSTDSASRDAQELKSFTPGK